ncbi:hypothetical protein [Culturomica massiliensis]|uniref:hypothetical protein n=1 Tax=Culturomica massiliensis TaxID=1841857 RepID=UPI0008384F02|nr:hypothetical protein [Culturomica massiliensis]
MKILLIIMGMLNSPFFCTDRRVKLTEEKKSVQTGYEIGKSGFHLDSDTLSANPSCSYKGNNPIGMYKRFDVDVFQGYYNDFNVNNLRGFVSE